MSTYSKDDADVLILDRTDRVNYEFDMARFDVEKNSEVSKGSQSIGVFKDPKKLGELFMSKRGRELEKAIEAKRLEIIEYRKRLSLTRDVEQAKNIEAEIAMKEREREDMYTELSKQHVVAKLPSLVLTVISFVLMICFIILLVMYIFFQFIKQDQVKGDQLKKGIMFGAGFMLVLVFFYYMYNKVNAETNSLVGVVQHAERKVD